MAKILNIEYDEQEDHADEDIVLPEQEYHLQYDVEHHNK